MNKQTKYILTMDPDQAKTACKAIELLMRLKLGQYEELPFALIDISRDDFCDRRDIAKPHLKAAFDQMLGYKARTEYKDEEWHKLYNLFQVIRHAIWKMEHPDSMGVDSYPPMDSGGVGLPEIEIRAK